MNSLYPDRSNIEKAHTADHLASVKWALLDMEYHVNLFRIHAETARRWQQDVTPPGPQPEKEHRAR